MRIILTPRTLPDHTYYFASNADTGELVRGNGFRSAQEGIEWAQKEYPGAVIEVRD